MKKIINVIGILLSVCITEFSNAQSCVTSMNGPSTVCVGASPSYYPTCKTGSGQITWVNGPNFSWTQGTSQVTFHSEGSYVIDFHCDCNDGSETRTKTVTVTSSDSDAGAIGGDGQIMCKGGDPAILTNVTSAQAPPGFTYSWFYSDDLGTSWISIAGEDDETYDPPGNFTSDERWYIRQITSCGSTVKNSNIVKVKTYGELARGHMTNRDQFLCAGDEGSMFSGSDSGGDGNGTYQWFLKVGTNYEEIEGADQSFLQPGIVNSSREYRRRFISCNDTLYHDATITVGSQSLQPGIIVGNQSIAYNTEPFPLISSFDASSENDNFQYQWQFSTNGCEWVDVIGENDELIRPDKLKQTTKFRRLVRECGAELTSNELTVTVGLPSNFSDQDLNYVRTTMYQNPVTDKALVGETPAEIRQSIVYYDGLGRVNQEVDRFASPNEKDMVMPHVYDKYSMKSQTYLPYASDQNNGLFKINAISQCDNTDDDQFQFYQTAENVAHDIAPYSKTVYDYSVTDRVTEQGAPGSSWQPASGASLQFRQELNTNADNVLLWRVDDISGNFEQEGYYAERVLTKNTTIDEENHEVVEFTDKLGQTILKRVQADEVGTEWADTYYIYDDYRNLRFVLPPEASADINTYLTGNATTKTSFLDRWAFQYQYDGRQRMTGKRVPGADWVYMIYDNRDRLVLTQDANQRMNNEWLFTKYDVLNRPIATGKYYADSNWEDLQKRVNDFYAQQINWSGMSYVTVDQHTLTKSGGATGWGVSGATSDTYIPSGKDGILSVRMTNNTHHKAFGLSEVSTNDHFNTIDFAFKLHLNSDIQIYESGTLVGVFGSYVAEDILSIERKGNQINYYKNNELLHSTVANSTSSLVIDVAFYSEGGTLEFLPPSYYESAQGAHYDYTNSSFPTLISDKDYLTLTYYDNYDFHHARLVDYEYQPSIVNPIYFSGVKGHVTGGMTKVLGMDDWIKSVNYYDDRYRVIQSISNNHKEGYDIVSNEYDFVGKVLKTQTTHSIPEKLLWSNHKSVIEESGVFHSVASGSGWNAGLSSVNKLNEDEDGWVETVISETASYRFLGFNDQDLSTNFNEMEYSIYMIGKTLRAYYQGAMESEIGTVEVGDVLRLSRESDTVKVYQNQELLYQYNTTSTSAYVIDISLHLNATMGYISSSFSVPRVHEAPYPIRWTGRNRMEASQDGLTRTHNSNKWDGNVSSINRLEPGANGWLSFEAVTTNKALMIGLAEKDLTNGYERLDYAIYLTGAGEVKIRENGVNKFDFGSYVAGDVFKIERIGETIYYSQNGGVFYTSEVPSATALIADVSFHTTGASVAGLQSSFYIDHPERKDIQIKRQFDYDHAQRLVNTWHELSENTTWATHNGTEEIGGVLSLSETETSGIALSSQTLAPFEDGYVEYVAEDLNNAKKISLTYADEPIHYFQFYAYHPIVVVRRNLSTMHANTGNYQIGDKFKIEKKGSKLYFYKNEVLQADIDIDPSLEYKAVVHLAESESKVSALRFGQAPVLLSHNEYNELGELIEKNIHSEDEGNSFAQSTDYRYNIRGWLTRINTSDLSEGETVAPKDYFGMELAYQETMSGVSNSPAYNGNISAIKWSNDLGLSGLKENAYAYTYDPMNRLKTAGYRTKQAAWSTTNHFQVNNINYDLNGNIETLDRKDHRGIDMDRLTYDYGVGNGQSNQLLSVTDASPNEAGFKDGNTGSDDYIYDPNGNMTQDLNKDIVDIDYNYLNLPQSVEKADGQRIRYVYDAAGMKLAQVVEEGETHTDLSSWETTKVTLTLDEGPSGTESGVNKLQAQSSSGFHQIFVRDDVTRKRVKLEGDIYIPSGNPSVNGVRLSVGGDVSDFSYTTDQWVHVSHVTYSGSTTISLVMLANGSPTFSTSTDLVYFKDLEYTAYEGKTTDYLGEFIYENDEVQLIQHEEGRIVKDETTNSWAYHYHLKDHLGNTRTTFTTKPKEISFKLTYEGDSDESLFEDVTINDNDIFDHTDAGGTTYTHSQILTGAANSQVGSVIAIPVGTGDKLTASVMAKYVDVPGSTNPAPAIASALVGAFTGGTGTTNEFGNTTINNNFGSSGLIGTAGFPVENSTAPMAFLNVMFLPEGESIDLVKDATFAYDQIDGGAVQLVTQPKNQNYDELRIEDFEAPQIGYVLIYLSNENGTFTEVHFDDLVIDVTEHPVIQTDDYYPFGLTFGNGYKRVSAKENRFLFGDKELQSGLDLGWYDFHARQYDATLGRMLSVDPLSELTLDWTPYRFGFNNPLRFTDPTGMSEVDENGNTRYTDPDEIGYVYAGLQKRFGNGDSNEGGCPKGMRCEENEQGGTNAYDKDGNLVEMYPPGHDFSEDRKREALGNTWAAVQEHMVEDAVTETVLFMAGELVLVKIFQGGRWVYRVIKASRARKAAQVVETSVEVLARDKSGAVQYLAKYGDETLDIVAHSKKTGDQLFLRSLDIQGSQAGKITVKGLFDLARQLGRNEGVKQVIIQGNVRSSGKYIGKIPSEVVINVN